MGDIPVRFHQSISFLPTNQVLPLARACDELGYGGIYVSDHIFNPRALASRYTYSVREDGAPSWEPETQWPDPMCLISGLATATEHLAFTTGVYIAPLRDLITVARTVGTAAVLSDNRVRLGVGVGWCKEEFDQTGQDFASRGPRLSEMIAALRALWRGGWVEFHGDYYDVPECQIEPAPTAPVPIHRRRALPGGGAAGGRALRRVDRGRGVQRGGGVGPPRRPGGARAGRPAARTSPSPSISRSTNGPTSTCTAVSPRPASATSCAPPGCSSRSIPELPTTRCWPIGWAR